MSRNTSWWLSGVMAVVVLTVAIGVLTMRFGESGTSKREMDRKGKAPAHIGLSRVDPVATGDLVGEEARFFDPSPLFLPTEWNAAQDRLPSNVLVDSGQMFQDFPASLVFERDALALRLPAVGATRLKPIDVVSSLEDMSKFSGLGQRDLIVAQLPQRGGYIEVVSAGDGQTVLREVLAMDGLEADLWRPLELAGVVNVAGLLGQLAVIESTGGADRDERLRDHILTALHLGERLDPGFYRIFVGP